MATLNITMLKKHLTSTFKSKRIIGLVILILLANQLGGIILKAFIDININFTAQYIFEEIWKDIPALLHAYWIYFLTLVPAIHFSITLIGLACFRRMGEQFISGYWQKYTAMGSSNMMALVWFYKQKLFINLAYGAFLSALYLTGCLFYYLANINLLWFFVPLIAVTYPIFYFTQSVVGLLATLPLQNQERSSSLKYLYCKKGIASLYCFYALRIGLEMFLAFILPLVLLKLNIFEFLIPWLMIIGLAVPFSFLRSLSYEIKLQIFKGDSKINALLQKKNKL